MASTSSFAYDTLREATARHPVAPARSFYSSDAWLDLLHDHGHRYRWLLLAHRDHTALAPLTPGQAVHSARYHPDFLLAGRLPADGCLIAGPRSGYHNELRHGPEALSVARLGEGLQAAIAAPVPDATSPPDAGPGPDAAKTRETRPERERKVAALLPYLPSRTAVEFEAAGHPVGLIAWDAWLDVTEGGFDDYLAGLDKTRRNQVKGDLRRLARAGVTFATRPLAGPYGALAELLVLHERKYDPGYDQPPARFARYLERCARVPGAYVIQARIEGDVIGCHVLFHYRDALWVRLLGVDDSEERARGCYFALMFYEPLRLAHRLGARAIHLGIGTSDAKARRGARLEPLWTAAVTGGGKDRDRARAGLVARALDLPDPVPERLGPHPAAPSAWSPPTWTG